MAKLSRKQRREIKQKQQRQLLKAGVKQSEITQLSNKELEQKYTSIVTEKRKQNQRRERHRKQAKSRAEKLDFKRNSLEALGFDKRFATRVKYEDIEAYKRGENTLTREKYPFLFVGGFDYDKVYKFQDGKRMFVAYRDYQGEIDFEQLLNDYKDKSPEQLLRDLEEIVNRPREHNGWRTGSSGVAGEYKFQVASQTEIELFNKDAIYQTKREARMKNRQEQNLDAKHIYHTPKTKQERLRKRRQFKGEKVGFQVLKDGQRVSFDKVTPRNLLIMANAIMHNVTEVDRENFYKRFYEDIVKNIPEMGEILPNKP